MTARFTTDVGYPSTVDQLVAALREDPVYVDPTFGNGHTDAARDGLRDLVDEAGFTTYVVVAPAPADLGANDPARDLATRLQTELDVEDGAVLVTLDSYQSAVVTTGSAPDARVVGDAATELFPEGGADAGLSAVGRTARDLDVLVQDGDVDRSEYESWAGQAVWRRPDEWDLDYEIPGEGAYAVWTTMSFVVGSLVCWMLLRTAFRWRETAPAPGGSSRRRQEASPAPVTRRGGSTTPALDLDDPADLRRLVDRTLDDAAQRLSRRGADLSPEHRETADGSYDTARLVLGRAGTAAADVPDLVGALVLARTTLHAVDHGTRRRRPGTPYRTCFFDPRHGDAPVRRPVALGDDEIEVPACRACARSAVADLRPLEAPGRGRLGRTRPQPYYLADSVWATTGYGAFVDDLWQVVATDLRGRRP